MPLTLTATDLRTDPPTAAVTLAGTGGAAAVVYAASADPVVPQSWAAVGSRTGDGSVTVTALPRGTYWLYAAAAALVSPPALLVLTDGRDAPWTRCRAAVAARIGLIGLTTFTAKEPVRVVQQWWPDQAGLTYPVIHLTVDNVNEDVKDSVNAFDDVGYPVRVSIADSAVGGATPNHRMMPWFEAARWRIERAFSGQHLPGVPESTVCRVEPFPAFNPDAPGYLAVVCGLVVRCYCRLPRGLNV